MSESFGTGMKTSCSKVIQPLLVKTNKFPPPQKNHKSNKKYNRKQKNVTERCTKKFSVKKLYLKATNRSAGSVKEVSNRVRRKRAHQQAHQLNRGYAIMMKF